MRKCINKNAQLEIKYVIIINFDAIIEEKYEKITINIIYNFIYMEYNYDCDKKNRKIKKDQ